MTVNKLNLFVIFVLAGKCDRALGMFSGEIEDSSLSSSSSFDHTNTGPHNAR